MRQGKDLEGEPPRDTAVAHYPMAPPDTYGREPREGKGWVHPKPSLAEIDNDEGIR